VPVFLMWIYLSWLTFLFGAAIAATLPQLRATRFADAKRAGNDAVTALALVKLLYEARGAAPARGLCTAELAASLRSDPEETGALLAQLEGMGYLRRLVRSDGADEEWVLACDPRRQGLGRIFHRLAFDPENSLLRRADLGLDRWLAPLVRGPWLDQPLDALDRAASGPAD